MSPIYSSIPLLLFGCSLLFAISSAATRPAPDSTRRGFDHNKETIIDPQNYARSESGRNEMENNRLDNFDEDRLQELEEYFENDGGTREDSGPVYPVLEKRPASSGKYNYYRCYFNPVTCYRK